MLSTHVRLERLCKRYGSKTAVEEFSLDIEAGSMVALLGPSGCGKTTCLRMIAGLVKPTSGEIHVSGREMTHVPVHRRNIGMLFQNYALFPHLSVAQNVAFGLQMRGVKAADADRRVREALALVRLAEYGDRLPGQLSGGQQQRVALARAIVIEPSMLLLDEPLGALDKGLRENMQVELRALQKRLGLTTVMVTHDQDEALTMADQVVVMRDGRIEQSGSAEEIYRRPASRFVANFIGASNMFSGVVERSDSASSLVVTSAGHRLVVPRCGSEGSGMTVSVRPESIELRKSGDTASGQGVLNTVSARIDQIVYRGFMSHYYLRLADGQQIIAFQQNDGGDRGPGLEVGDAVVARWSTASNHVLAEA
jgi:spermidine/putrescine ABC transporter ATP-binding subunit